MAKSSILLTLGLLLLLAISAQAAFKLETVPLTSTTFASGPSVFEKPFVLSLDAQNEIIYAGDRNKLRKIDSVTLELQDEVAIAPGAEGLVFVPAESPYVVRGYQDLAEAYLASDLTLISTNLNVSTTFWTRKKIIYTNFDQPTIYECWFDEGEQVTTAYQRFTVDLATGFWGNNILLGSQSYPQNSEHFGCDSLVMDPISGEVWSLEHDTNAKLSSFSFTGNVLTTEGKVVLFATTTDKIGKAMVAYNRTLAILSHGTSGLYVQLYQPPPAASITFAQQLPSVFTYGPRTVTGASTTSTYSMVFDAENSNLIIGTGSTDNSLIVLKIVGNTIVDNALVTLVNSGAVSGSASTLTFDSASSTAFLMKQNTSFTVVSRFPLADCSSKLDCTACNSDYCGWCFPTGTCTAIGACSYTNLFFVNAVCPGNDNPTATPSSVEKSEATSFSVTLENPRFVDPTSETSSVIYTCLFNSTVSRAASYVSATQVSCDSGSLTSLTSPSSKYNTTLDVMLNGRKFDGTTIEVIDCAVSRSCVHCSAIGSQCSWCPESNSCSPTSQCASPNNTCPNPSITSLSANTGAIAGGTTLTVTGADFLLDYTQVLVADVPCDVDSFDGESSTLVCDTGVSASAKQGPVSIQFGDSSWLNSTALFSYTANPVVTSITPNKTIAAGGNVLTLTGENLGNTGNAVSLTLAGSPLCTILSHTATTITCRVTPQTSGLEDFVDVAVDSQGFDEVISFTVFANPSVTAVSPLKAPKSGGISLSITGNSFAVGPLAVSVGGTNCAVQTFNDTHITCKLASGSAAANLPVTIKMFNTNFASTTPNLFTIANDPVVIAFSPLNSAGLGADNVVTITGTDLDTGVAKVTVATCECKVISVTSSVIKCKLPTCPETGPIVVAIGDSKTTSTIEFNKAAEESGAWVGAVIGSVVGVAAILAIVVAVIYFRRRAGGIQTKSRQPVRDPASRIFVAFNNATAVASDAQLQTLETHLESILLGGNMDIFSMINSSPEGEVVMRAVGLFLFEKEFLIQVFDHFCQIEVRSAEDPQRLFRGPDVSSRLYRAVLKPITFNYYWNLLGPIIDLLIENDVMKMTGDKFSRASADVEMMSEADKETFEHNVYKTQLIAHQLVANIMKSKNSMPKTLREILFAVGRETEQKYGKEARNNSLTTFLVLRFISAILITPTPYCILSDEQKDLSDGVTNMMANLSSISVKVSSGKEFNDRDGKLAELNPFIRQHIPKFQAFYDDVMDKFKMANVSNACPVLPKHVKGLVLAEINNCLLQNKEAFLRTADEKMREKLNALYETSTKPIACGNKNFSFSNY